jgi:hypothetical protein
LYSAYKTTKINLEHIDRKPDTTNLEAPADAMQLAVRSEPYLNWRRAWTEDPESDSEGEAFVKPTSEISIDFLHMNHQQASNAPNSTPRSKYPEMTSEQSMFKLLNESNIAWFTELLENSTEYAETFFTASETGQDLEDGEGQDEEEYMTTAAARTENETEKVVMDKARDWSPWYQKWMGLKYIMKYRLGKTVGTLQKMGRALGENGYVAVSCGFGDAVWLPIGACFFPAENEDD